MLGPTLMDGNRTLRESITAHDQAVLVHLLQLAVCNALHPVEARVCRWLLAAMKRVQQPELPITQKLLADLLGVRRTTITRVLAQLTEEGLIRRRRGWVMVIDPQGLAGSACGCHDILRRQQLRHVAPSLYPELSPRARLECRNGR